MKRPSRTRRWLRRLLVLSGTGLLLVASAFFFAPTILCVDSGHRVADAIVVLGGDAVHRPARAAELFRSGVGKMVIVSGDGDCHDAKTALKAGGVPLDRIVIECESGSTKENASFTVEVLRRSRVKRALIVTSWFHSRRALATFKAAAPEIEFFSRPTYYGRDRTGWNSNGIRAHITHEYLKIVYYWARWGVTPL